MASSWFDLLVTSHYQEEPCACPAHHLLSQAGLQSTEIGFQAVEPTNPDKLPEMPKKNYTPEQLPLSYAWDALMATPPAPNADAAWNARSVAFSATRATTQPEEEEVIQADLLRDVLGNPFRPVALDPAWRTPTVTAL